MKIREYATRLLVTSALVLAIGGSAFAFSYGGLPGRSSDMVADVGALASKLLFCAYGPDRTSPASQAVVVVELDSPSQIDSAAVSRFTLLTAEGVETPFDSLVKVEEFFAELDSTRFGINARYMNPGTSLSPDGVRPWDGALPKGVFRLRIRVATKDRDIARSNRCRVVIGPHTVEGLVNGGWTGS
jgi:hypothetical protein